MKYFIIVFLIGFAIAQIFVINSANALEFSPLVLTDRDDIAIHEGIVLQPVKFHLTLSNDESDSVDLNVNFTTYTHDDIMLDSKASTISIGGKESKIATYWFVPTTEGNYLTSVFVEYKDGTIPYSGDAIAFLALDATKEYKKQKITMHSDSLDEDCNVLCTNPAILTINAGTIVEWVNESPSYRSIATGEYIEEENGISWNSDHRLQSHSIGPDEKFSFLFLEAGNYQYFVAEHRLNQVAGTIYVTALDTSIDRTIDTLEQIMNNQNSPIPITSLSVNEKNSIITVGIDDSKDPNISLDVYKKMLRKQIGNVYLEVISDTKAHNVESPLKQFRSGISIDKTECRNDLVLIQKHDGSPACVTSKTKLKLIERGWAIATESTTTDNDSPVIKDVDFTKIVDANNQFALKFYSQTAQDSNENIFFSPWSITTAFSIAYEGARNDTAQEIRTMFEFPQDDNLRRSLFQDIQNDLNAKNADYSLNTANALWIKEGYKIEQDYIDTAKVYYDSQVDNVDFATDEGVNTINEWVKTKTNNKIEQLLEPGSTDELTRLIITNAIYFNGEWVYPFSPSWTKEADFHVSPDKTVTVLMMDLDDRKLNYTENETIEILELPYKGERISMLVLLPKEIDGLKSLEQNLTPEKLLQWREDLSEKQIAVFLPKFTLETKYNLKNSLQDMGMKIPFDKFNADFSGINDTERLYIDDALHKAFVNVYELGTEAAAATGVEVRTTSGPLATFRADHPFLFIIQDNETGQILFMGRMTDPTK